MGIHLLTSGRRAIRAALIFVLLGGLGLPLRAAHAQDADPRIPLTVRSGEGDVFTLTLGLAPEATNGIDPALGEQEQPPTPPSEVFDVRLVDDNVPVSGFGEGLLKDIRPGGAQFEGTTQHQIRFQAASGTDLTIAWDLPEGVTGTIQNVPDGGAYGKDMTGRDSLMVDAGAPDAIVTLEYAPNQAPTLSLDPPNASIAENNSPPIRVATVSVADDGLGTNERSLSGPDAGSFALTDANGLVLTESADAEATRRYSVTVAVNDPAVAPSPNDSEEFSLRVDDVNEPPVLETNSGLALSPGGSATLTTGNLSASDPDDAPTTLTYVVTQAPTRGELLVGSSPAASFTQTDLREGAVQYDHTASDTDNDQFSFAVGDEAGARGPEATFRIAVDPSTHRTTIRGTDGTGNDTGWRLLAPPSNTTRRAFEDDLAFGVNSEPLLYTWDGTEWTPATDSSAALPRGEGFILYFFDDKVDPISADGLTLDIPDLNEDQTADVTVDGLDASRSLHLLGNPYDVAFDLGALAGGDLSGRGFQNTVQVWDPSGGGQWTLITQGEPDDTIPAWQGFFVERARGPRPDPPYLQCGRPTVCPGRPHREQARAALGLPGRTGPAGPVPRRGERVRHACPKRRHPAFPRGRRHGLGHVRSHPAPAPDRERLRHVDQPPSAQRRTGPPNPRQRAPTGAEQDPLLSALGPVGRDNGHGHRAVARVEARPRPPYVDRGAGRPRDRCRRGPA
ncbi:cadherin-like domain-containing protein [Salinibacter ruber]|nr:cadherin-like domain-containing protein [Salinibacter ruber]